MSGFTEPNQRATVRRKQKTFSKDELNLMSKEDLIERVMQLEAHNAQLQNVITKKLTQSDIAPKCGKQQKKVQRPFDFSKCHTRHILLKFFYLGWDYQGFACQEDTTKTIEHEIFAALKKTCLIKSRETSNYHRCGRTDKGVSAFSQVISIDVRSKWGILDQEIKTNHQSELDYCGLLNRVLPQEIRCLSWMPLNFKDYSARFDCNQRTYRYFFPLGNLNISNMSDACKLLIGQHDFRNLCKMDVANGVLNFTRTIIDAKIFGLQYTSHSSSYDMYCFELTGHAFLWHQVRCIMAVLLMVGQNLEDPTVITELLDVKTNPRKPQYSLASDIPLNLYDVQYSSKSNESTSNLPSDINDWVISQDNLTYVIKALQSQWTISSIKTTMMREMLLELERQLKDTVVYSHADILLQGIKAKAYKKLLTRDFCESLESRIDHYTKKRRIDVVNTTSTTGGSPSNIGQFENGGS